MHKKQQQGEDGPDNVGLKDRLFLCLFQLGNAIQRERARQGVGTSAQWAVLSALNSAPERGLSLCELAERIIVSRQSLDGVLHGLEGAGYIVRNVTAADRRMRRVRMTDSGTRFWNESQVRLRQFDEQVVASFSIDDEIALLRQLDSLQLDMESVDLAKQPVPESPP